MLNQLKIYDEIVDWWKGIPVSQGLPAWASSLQEILAGEQCLPDRQSWRAAFSPQLSYGRHFSPPGPSAKPASVMILMQLQHAKDDWTDATIPLTVRPAHLPDHPGQISLPGGRVEVGEDTLSAATREFEEELGVSAFPGQVLGELQPIWVFNSDYHLTPFVAVHAGQLMYQPCHHEVDRLIHFPVRELLTATEHVGNFTRGSVNWQARYFPCGLDKVWGATAIVLGELAAILRAL